MSERPIHLGMPSYGNQTNDAGRGFWNACHDGRARVVHDSKKGSLLASNFNALWCNALNRAHWGERVDYVAMQHDDIGPPDCWLDAAIEELDAKGLDILGVVVPIKDGRSLTSLALHNGPIASNEDEFALWMESCGIEHSELDDEQRANLLAAYAAWYQRICDWRPFCRLSMHDVMQLPETFTSEDLGRPLLLNSGLWVCKFNMDWATKVHFEINNRIAFDPKKDRYHEQTEPEDWFFSRQLHELGLKIGATRKIVVKHRGEADFYNNGVWGQPFDSEYTNKSPLPEPFPYDVAGWLRYDEGKALTELSRGKRVLEIGSYCGRSTICIAQTAKSVTCVDYFDGRATGHPRDTSVQFHENTARYGVADKLTICHPDSDIQGAFDLAFIDGAHDVESVMADIHKALAVLAPDGLLAFHDYRTHPGEVDGAWDPGVPAAVNGFVENGAEIISRHGTIAVVRPPAHILSEA